MSSLKFGLIGASYVAASRMMPAFAANGIAPKALFDTDESRFKYWVDAGLDLLTSDLDQLLDSDIDAVYISSRNDQHAAQAIAAADAGKHILLEKPMALTLADARAIVEAADRNGVQLAVNHHLPGSPLHSTARRLVAEGRIGTLYSARINHAVLLPESLRGWRLASVPGGGVVFDITVHDASVLNPLFAADPVRVSAVGVSQAAWNTARSRDSVMTIIEYAPGARWCRRDRPDPRRVHRAVPRHQHGDPRRLRRHCHRRRDDPGRRRDSHPAHRGRGRCDRCRYHRRPV